MVYYVMRYEENHLVEADQTITLGLLKRNKTFQGGDTVGGTELAIPSSLSR